MAKIEEVIKQQTKFKSSVEKAFVNLVYTGNWIGMKQKRYFRKHDGISPQQYNVLRILRGQQGKPVTILEIQARMLDQMSNASRLVDKLFKKGYVDRKESSIDRRQVDIVLSDKGSEMLKVIDKEMKSFMSELIDLSEEEAEQLSNLLDKMRKDSIFY